MQSALCIQDLGQLYHKPLRDSHGTVVLACVNNVKVWTSVVYAIAVAYAKLIRLIHSCLLCFVICV